MTTLPPNYQKLIIHELTGDFRSATRITSQPLELPGAGQVLVRNVYAGVNGIFDKQLCRQGIRYLTVVPPFDMGIESVGTVAAVGAGVHDFAPGDAVATSRLGSGYREYQLAEPARLTPIHAPTPEILTLLPSGVSAMVGLERIAEMRGGETVAVAAAAGGLGHMVVQLAKLAGCHVIGLTGSESKLDLLQSLGVDRPINYRREDLHSVLEREYPRGLDIGYDSVGGEIFDVFLDHLAMRGRLIVSGHTSDFDQPVEAVAAPRIYRKLYWKSASVRAFQNQAFPEFQADSTRRILELYYAGRLRPVVDPTIFAGLSSVADAVEHLLAGRNAGKVVVRL